MTLNLSLSSLKSYATSLVEPLLLMGFSLLCLVRTCLTSPLLLLRSPSAFRSKWFQGIFAAWGPQIAADPEQSPYLEDLLSRAHGTVLELGPGGGDQTFHFKSNKIDKIYAAEPNAFFHTSLLLKANENRLGGRYIPIEAGAEPESLLPALKKAGLLPHSTSSLPKEGVFDSIVAVKSMCSADHSQLLETVTVLWWLLKPGGEFLFFEHLENDDSLVTQTYARMLNIMWPALMGGCRLDGKLDKIIMKMQGWEKREMRNMREYEGHEVFRYGYGVCTKQR